MTITIYPSDGSPLNKISEALLPLLKHDYRSAFGVFSACIIINALDGEGNYFIYKFSEENAFELENFTVGYPVELEIPIPDNFLLEVS